MHLHANKLIFFGPDSSIYPWRVERMRYPEDIPPVIAAFAGPVTELIRLVSFEILRRGQLFTAENESERLETAKCRGENGLSLASIHGVRRIMARNRQCTSNNRSRGKKKR